MIRMGYQRTPIPERMMVPSRLSRMSPGTRGTTGEGRGTAGKGIRDRSARPAWPRLRRRSRVVWKKALLQVNSPELRTAVDDIPPSVDGVFSPDRALEQSFHVLLRDEHNPLLMISVYQLVRDFLL